MFIDRPQYNDECETYRKNTEHHNLYATVNGSDDCCATFVHLPDVCTPLASSSQTFCHLTSTSDHNDDYQQQQQRSQTVQKMFSMFVDFKRNQMIVDDDLSMNVQKDTVDHQESPHLSQSTIYSNGKLILGCTNENIHNFITVAQLG